MEGNPPVTMNMSNALSPIREMSHLNLVTHSQTSSGINVVYNNSIFMMEETIVGGFNSQQGLADDSIGQIPSVGDETQESIFTSVNNATQNLVNSGRFSHVNKPVTWADIWEMFFNLIKCHHLHMGKNPIGQSYTMQTPPTITIESVDGERSWCYHR